MSVALETRVAALERERERDTALMAVDLLAQRVNTLQAQVELLVELAKPRKPGPKPKENHGS